MPEMVYILSAEHFGTVQTEGGVLHIEGLEIPYLEWHDGKVHVYVRRSSKDLSIMEVHMTRHAGLAEEQLEQQNAEANADPRGPEAYWRDRGYEIDDCSPTDTDDMRRDDCGARLVEHMLDETTQYLSDDTQGRDARRKLLNAWDELMDALGAFNIVGGRCGAPVIAIEGPDWLGLAEREDGRPEYEDD